MKLAWWPWCPAWCVCPEKGFCSQELIPKEHVTRIIKTCFLIFILIIALSWSIWNFKIIFNSLQKLPQVRNSTLSKKVWCSYIYVLSTVKINLLNICWAKQLLAPPICEILYAEIPRHEPEKREIMVLIASFMAEVACKGWGATPG